MQKWLWQSTTLALKGLTVVQEPPTATSSSRNELAQIISSTRWFTEQFRPGTVFPPLSRRPTPLTFSRAGCLRSDRNPRAHWRYELRSLPRTSFSGLHRRGRTIRVKNRLWAKKQIDPIHLNLIAKNIPASVSSQPHKPHPASHQTQEFFVIFSHPLQQYPTRHYVSAIGDTVPFCALQIDSFHLRRVWRSLYHCETRVRLRKN